MSILFQIFCDVFAPCLKNIEQFWKMSIFEKIIYCNRKKFYYLFCKRDPRELDSLT